MASEYLLLVMSQGISQFRITLCYTVHIVNKTDSFPLFKVFDCIFFKK